MALTDKQVHALILMIYEGKLKREAAEAVGVVPETISNWFNNVEFLKTFQEMRAKLLEEASYKALQQVISLAESAESETVRLNASKDIMSRSGMDPVQKQEITQKNFTIDLDDIIDNIEQEQDQEQLSLELDE